MPNSNKATEARDTSLHTTTDALRSATATAQEALRSGLGSTAEAMQRSTDQVFQAFGVSGENAKQLTEQSSQNLQVIAQASSVMAQGVQEISREVIRLTQERLQKNIDGLNALTRCRSWQDLVAVQTDLVRDNLQQMIENTRRVAEMSVEAAEEASNAMTGRQARPGPNRRAA
jgi:phasin family protein